MQDRPPTPIDTLMRAQEIGRDVGIHYIYVGNVWGLGETTVCPNCAEMVIQRKGFAIQHKGLTQNRCSRCKQVIAGIWQ